MAYLQDVEREFLQLYEETLRDYDHKDVLVDFVTTKVLQSYHNGIAEGKNPRKKTKAEKE